MSVVGRDNAASIRPMRRKRIIDRMREIAPRMCRRYEPVHRVISNLDFPRRFRCIGAANLKQFQVIRSSLFALGCGLIFAGCASHYAVLLTNGQHYTAAEKPSLIQTNGQFAFMFTDLSGETNVIPSGLVRAVVPASDLKPAQ